MMSTTCTENTVDRFLPSGRGPNLLTLDLARENEIPLLLYLGGRRRKVHIVSMKMDALFSSFSQIVFVGSFHMAPRDKGTTFLENGDSNLRRS